MKASELITLLQDAIDKYGDLPVHVRDTEFQTDHNPIILPLDAGSYAPQDLAFDGKAVEIWITPHFKSLTKN